MKRRILTILAVGCLLIGLFGGMTMPTMAAKATTYAITDLAGHYKTQGRTCIKDGALLLDWSASALEFDATCEGDVSLELTVSGTSGSSTGGVYFTVLIDGVAKERTYCHLNSNGTQSFKLGTVEPGKHSFAFVRQTEIGSLVGITGITLNGTVETAPADSHLYMEFIGDSITAAYGNLTTLGNGTGESLYQDATQGYAYLTAKALGADYSSVAVSGIGVTYGWTSYGMPAVYPKLRYPKDSSTAYDFTARTPHVVVVALGTNDANRYSTLGGTLAEVKTGFKNFLATVRSDNPSAKIVWMYNMMAGGVNDTVKEVIAEAGGADEGLYAIEMPRSTSGGNGHPTAAQQAVFAEKLSAFVRTIPGLPQHDTVTQWSSNADGHFHRCSCGAMLDLTAHTTATRTVPATLQAQGYDETYCTVCGYSVSKSNYTDYQGEDAPRIRIGEVTGKPGAVVSLPILMENNPGFSTLVVTVTYDPALTYTEVQNGTVCPSVDVGKNLLWCSETIDDITADGTLATISFILPETATAGTEYTVTPVFRESSNADEQDCRFVMVSGKITVVDSDIHYGDATGDITVDSKDVVRLRKYLAAYDFETGTSSVDINAGGDANGDGTIDSKDVVRLRKYLAAYDFETGTSTVKLGPDTPSSSGDKLQWSPWA